MISSELKNKANHKDTDNTEILMIPAIGTPLIILFFDRCKLNKGSQEGLITVH
jgi:hypothetical protein